MKNERAYSKEEIRESIRQRTEIVAPPDFVSVFREVREDALDSIDENGIEINNVSRNFGDDNLVARRNSGMDNVRPRTLVEKGISRSGNIFAYPFLEDGHGLFGADQRYVKRNEKVMRWDFETLQKYSPDFLAKKGIKTVEDFIRQRTDPELLRAKYPGEVIEMKIDPGKSYVGDMGYFTNIMEDVNRGVPESEAIAEQAGEYWGNLITLEEFLRWYKKPEFAEDGNSIKDAGNYRDGKPTSAVDFLPTKDCPDSFPAFIRQPEILIPEDVPQERIKLVR